MCDIAFSIVDLANRGLGGVAAASYKHQASVSVGIGPQSIICPNHIQSTGREHPLGRQTLLTDTVVCEPQGWRVKWAGGGGGGFVAHKGKFSAAHAPDRLIERDRVTLGWMNGGSGGFHAPWKLLYSRRGKKNHIPLEMDAL